MEHVESPIYPIENRYEGSYFGLGKNGMIAHLKS